MSHLDRETENKLLFVRHYQLHTPKKITVDAFHDRGIFPMTYGVPLRILLNNLGNQAKERPLKVRVYPKMDLDKFASDNQNNGQTILALITDSPYSPDQHNMALTESAISKLLYPTYLFWVRQRMNSVDLFLQTKEKSMLSIKHITTSWGIKNICFEEVELSKY